MCRKPTATGIQGLKQHGYYRRGVERRGNRLYFTCRRPESLAKRASDATVLLLNHPTLAFMFSPTSAQARTGDDESRRTLNSVVQELFLASSALETNAAVVERNKVHSFRRHGVSLHKTPIALFGESGNGSQHRRFVRLAN